MEDGQMVAITIGDRVDQLRIFFLNSPENLVAAMMLILVSFVWISSGAMASSIAEKRLRGPFFHFFLGLMFPVIYPLAIAFLMGAPKTHREKAQQISEGGGGDGDDMLRLDGPPPVVENRKRRHPGATTEDTLQSQSSIYRQSYFKDICFDDAGRSRGPFSLVVQGVELRIERIVDPLPELVIVETINADGKQQTLRIPYAQIESCREI